MIFWIRDIDILENYLHTILLSFEEESHLVFRWIDRVPLWSIRMKREKMLLHIIESEHFYNLSTQYQFSLECIHIESHNIFSLISIIIFPNNTDDFLISCYIEWKYLELSILESEIKCLWNSIFPIVWKIPNFDFLRNS